MNRLFLLILLIWSTAVTSLHAATEPEEIEDIKQAASVHLQGKGIEDGLIQVTDFPGQERRMAIDVSKVYKGSELVSPQSS